MYITFIIVSVSKIYSIATVNIRIVAAGQLHDTRVDQRKLCALSRRRVVNAIRGRSSANADALARRRTCR